MEKIEYKTILEKGTTELEQSLNNEAQDGWELVNYCYRGDKIYSYSAVLRRKVENN